MKLAIFLTKILPLIFWCLLILGFDSVYVAVLTALSAAIHELGHLIFALPYKKVSLPKADISGFRIKIDGVSYKEELLVAIGGPLVNILLGVVLLFLSPRTAFASYTQLFGIINLMTALSNLLPIEGYDGYKIIFSVCAMLFDNTGRCESLLLQFSFLFSALMCFLSLYLILKLGEGYWIFFVFFSLTVSAIATRIKHNF